MIDRVNVKMQVKELLRGRWGGLFLGLLLFWLVSAVPTFISSWATGASSIVYSGFSGNYYDPYSYSYSVSPWAVLGSISIFSYLIPLAASILLAWPLEVSVDGMFLKFLRNQNPPATSVFDAFQYYGSAVLGMLWRYLFTFLWSLLFLIPGIVKAYSYQMMTYIIAENPNIGYRQAMKLSMRMTDGYKMQLFVLDLSFIGWTILASFTLGILYIWLAPYMYSVRAAYYEEIKQSALQSGRLTPEDFQPQQTY